MTFGLITLSSLLASATASLSIRAGSAANTFDVLVDGELWFESGDFPSFRHNGRRYSAADGTLKMIHAESLTGMDAYGEFESVTWHWGITSPASQATFYVTAVRTYPSDGTLIFEQRFPLGANSSSAGDPDALISTFPSFEVSAQSKAATKLPPPSRAFIQYRGDMAGANARLDRWSSSACANSSSAIVGSGIVNSGPLIVFSTALEQSVVLSAASNFMAASQRCAASALSYGLMGNVSSVPAGFSLETIMSYSPSGPTRAMISWGGKLLARYGKGRRDAYSRDLTLQKLGYSTDNGAFYYYQTVSELLLRMQAHIAIPHLLHHQPTPHAARVQAHTPCGLPRGTRLNLASRRRRTKITSRR